MITKSIKITILTIPKDVTSMYDLGFFGVETDYSKAEIIITHQRKKNQILTKKEEEYNRNHSSRRIVVEHAICRLKRYRIMNDVFRNRLRKYDRISDMIAGLVNYRISNPI